MRNAIRNKRVQESIQRFRCGFLQSGREKLFNVLPARELARAVQEEVGVWRDRLYPPLVARLGKRVGERLEGASAAGWKWRGRPVKIVDGTTVTMPDTEENQARYPRHGKQKPGLGFPIARLVALVSLGCGVVLNWAMGPCKGKKTGEDALFRLLYGSPVKGDIVLADRYHCGYFTVAVLHLMGVDVLTLQHARRVTEFRHGRRLGKHDSLGGLEAPGAPGVDGAGALCPNARRTRVARGEGCAVGPGEHTH